MRYGFILVEGQTEQFFVRDLLAPLLREHDLSLQAILIDTSAKHSARRHRGGSARYTRWRRETLRLVKASHTILVTTMLDYYALPNDFPGRSEQQGDCFERVSYLEERFAQDINSPRFIPYIALHEFEAMLFAAPEEIAAAFPESRALHHLQQVRVQFRSPEEIDDRSPPSFRIQHVIAEYQKPLNGPTIAAQIGLQRIRRECRHFDQWLQAIEEHLGRFET